MTNVLELRGITKRFPGVIANENVDITLREGEILHFWGKTAREKKHCTVSCTAYTIKDEGTISVRGVEANIQEPNDAIALGIGMVHQHFMLVPVMTVTENVMLGIEPTKNGIFLDKGIVGAMNSRNFGSIRTGG